MRISKAGTELIKRFEGLRLESYRDIGGVWTVGYGSTGKHVHPHMHITKIAADAMLAVDIKRFEDAVNRMLHVSVTQGEFDALVSFSYNLGAHALHGSTLLHKLNDDDKQGAAGEFHRWNHVGHHEIAGLTRRRADEKEMFLS